MTVMQTGAIISQAQSTLNDLLIQQAEIQAAIQRQQSLIEALTPLFVSGGGQSGEEDT